MIERFVAFFVRRHTVANVITFMIVALGVSSALTIKRDNFPNVDYGVMMITTRYPGASPEDVELNVSNKIEEEVLEIEGIWELTSASMENVSLVYIRVDPDADQDEVEDQVRTAVGRVSDLPSEVTDRPLVESLTVNDEMPVIEVGLSGDVPYAELREWARRFEIKLERADGVGRIKRFGFRDREIKIEADPRKIGEYQVPVRAIVRAIQSRNIRASGGSLESYTSDKNILTLAQFADPMEVRDVIVRSAFDGPRVRVRDLAKVRDGFEPEKITARLNGKSSINFVIAKKEAADIIRTVDAVRRAADEFQKVLPEGITIGFSADYSRYVRNRLRVVWANGFLGLVFVMAALLAFLNFRAAFWVAMGLPISLLGTVFMLPMFDTYLDSVSLAAMIMVVGLIVDDGIIIAENISRHREMGKDPARAAIDGATEVFLPVVTTVVTTFLAFAPMFFMKGIMGKFIFCIPLVITLALMISLTEALCALPSHLSQPMPWQKEAGNEPAERPWFERFRRPFGVMLRRILNRRYSVIALFLMLFALSFGYAKRTLNFVLFPDQAADEMHIELELPAGASLRATTDRISEVERLLDALPKGEVASYHARIGKGREIWSGESENWGTLFIFLTPFASRERTAQDIIDDLRPKVAALDGIERARFHIKTGGPPVGNPITLRIVGSDDAMRARLTADVVSRLGAMPDVSDIETTDKAGKDEIAVRLDYDKLARLGLTVADVAQSVRLAYDGEVATTVRYGDEDVGFRVQLAASARHDASTLKNLRVPNDQGRLIRLSEVARFESGQGRFLFMHFDGERTVRVTAGLRKGGKTPLETTAELLGAIDLDRDYPGMRLLVGGEAEETANSMESLYSAFFAAGLGVYLVLLLLFDSPVKPLLVMTAVPFGLIGVILAFIVHGTPLGFIGMLGVVGLTGVVVNDSLVLVDYVDALSAKHPRRDFLDLLSEGAATRLRPILLTSITSISGLLPMAYGIGGSDPFMAPMALAMGYGILASTPLILILLPCLLAVQRDAIDASKSLLAKLRSQG